MRTGSGVRRSSVGLPGFAGTGRFGEPRGYTVVKIPPFQYDPAWRCGSGGNDVPANTPVPSILCMPESDDDGGGLDMGYGNAAPGSASAAQLALWPAPTGQGAAPLDVGFRDDVMAKMDEIHLDGSSK